MTIRYTSLDSVLRRYLEAYASNSHSCLVAEITAVAGTSLSCRPVWQNVIAEKGFDYPELREVPFVTLSGGTSSISFPIAKGDYCLLIVSERALDNFKTGTMGELPNSYRRHDLSDCIALVGIKPVSQAIPVPDTTTIEGDLIINGDVQMNGNVTISGTLKVDGEISSKADVKAGAISLKSHIHTAPSGGGPTSASQPAP